MSFKARSRPFLSQARPLIALALTAGGDKVGSHGRGVAAAWLEGPRRGRIWAVASGWQEPLWTGGTLGTLWEPGGTPTTLGTT